MALLDKIKAHLHLLQTDNDCRTTTTPVLKNETLSQQYAVTELNTLIESDYLFPFKSREEMRHAAAELHTYFSNTKLPEKRTLAGKGTIIGNPACFAELTLSLIINYWHDEEFVRDRICDLIFLKNCISKGQMLKAD